MMTIRTMLPPRGRDYRLDLLRGFANWAIYLDHIPNNAVNWLTQRNYGFSDAADLFVFISGYRSWSKNADKARSPASATPKTSG
jgi:hypothetical protein